MKKNISKLDEMQDQKLLKLEEYGFWIVFWGLAAAVLIQLIAGGTIQEVAGELVILFIGSIYVLFACLKNGLWTRKSTPSRKGNAVASIIPAIIIGLLNGIRLIQNKRLNTYSLLIVLAIMAAVWIVCFGILELSRAIYKKRRSQLDHASDESKES